MKEGDTCQIITGKGQPMEREVQFTWYKKIKRFVLGFRLPGDET